MRTLAAIITLYLASCTVSEVAVQGQYGEYIFKPHRPIVIEQK
jgi:hypothetical protein